MDHIRPLVASITISFALVALGAGASAVAPPARAANPASVSRASASPASASPINKYQQVSASWTDSAEAVSAGYVACPAGTVVVGGGVEIAGSGLSENVNGTYPYLQKYKGKTETFWMASISNSSSTAGTFTVYADCAGKPSKWTLVTGSDTIDRHDQQVTAAVGCPSGLVVLGGGGVNETGDTDQNLNTTSPYQDQDGWYVNAADDSPIYDTDVVAYAVCAKEPKGYAVVNGSAAPVGADDQEGAGVECPAGTSVLSGGTVSSSSAVTVELNSSYPAATNVWQAYEDDIAGDTSSVDADAVCATT